MWNIKTRGSLGCRDHVFVEFTVLRNMTQERGKVRPLAIRKADFQLLKYPLGNCPWGQVSGTELVGPKKVFLRAELAIPRSKKSGKEHKRSPWLSRRLQVT